MTDRTLHDLKLVSALLGALVLTGLAPCAAAEEPAAEQQADAAEEAPKPYRNGLRWTTASELNNFGYHVYRGESEDGPFERLTAEPILGAGTTDEPTRYEFVDEDVDPYATYWYYIESISKTGAKERFTPIFRKGPKLTPPSTDAEAGPEAAADDPGHE
jgi:hypothetical protein